MASPPAQAQDHCAIYLANLNYALSEGWDVRIWDGQGVAEKWASGINWQGNNEPGTGTDLFFPVNGVTGRETDNNLPSGTEFGSITICNDLHFFGGGTVQGWVHRGNAIKLRSWIRVFANNEYVSLRSACRIEFPIEFRATPIPYRYHELSAGDVDLTFTGPISIGPEPVGFGNINVLGSVSGSGHLSLGGVGRLGAANSFTSRVTMSSSQTSWTVENQGGLGSTNVPTFLSSGDLHFLPAVCPEPFQIGSGALYFDAAGGTVHNATISVFGDQGSIHSKGPTTLTQPLRRILEADRPSSVANSVDLTPKSVHLYGEAGGSLTLAGNVASVPAAEVFSGDLYNDRGLVILNVAGGLAASGALAVSGGDDAGSGTALRWQRSSQLPDTVNLRSDRLGLLDLNGNSQTIGKLTLRDGDVSTGAGVLTVTGLVERTLFALGIPLHDSVVTANMRLASATPSIWSVASSDAPLIMNANLTLAAGASSVLRKTGPGGSSGMVWPRICRLCSSKTA